MWHLELWQIQATAGWVGPTVAISLAVMAAAVLGMAVVVGMAALRVATQAQKIGVTIDGLQHDAADALKAVRRLTEQAQDLMVLLRNEAGAFAHTSRQLRRKVMRGVDGIERKVQNLEALYDVVHDEVEDAALGVATALRTARSGNGVLNQVRNFLKLSRR